MQIKVYRAALAGLALHMTAAAGAEEQILVPDSIPDVVTVDAEGLLETFDKIPELILIDARIAMDRQQGFIEGSISLPDVETDCDTLAVHIPALDRPTLFYCNGLKCGRSVKAIHTAKACGYTDLYWFRGGFEEWSSKAFPFLKE